jgi:HEAT repeat protein
MDEEIRKLIRTLIDYKKTREEKTDASNRLCKMDEAEVAPALMDHLYSGRCEWVAWTIGRIGVNDEQFNALLKHLGDPHKADGAAHALAELRDRRAAKPIMDALKKHKYPDSVRANLILALGNTESEEAIPILKNSLEDKYEFVRAYAVHGLGLTKSRAFVPLIMDALDDENSQVRIYASWALGHIGDERALPKLVQQIHHKYFDLCLEAAESLEKIGLQHIDENDRIRCLLVLGKTEELAELESESLQFLIKELESHSLDIWKNAAKALDRIGFEKLEKEQRMRCLFILKRADELSAIGEDAVPILLQALNYPQGEVKQNALEIIGKIGIPALPLVLERLEQIKYQDFEWSYLVKAVGSIARSNQGDRKLLSAVPALLQCKSDPPLSGGLLQNPIYSWMNPVGIHSRIGIPAPTYKVGWQDEDVVEALVAIGPTSSPHLIKHIKESLVLRQEAKKDPLKRFLFSGNAKRALLALCRFKEKEAIPCLIGVLVNGAPEEGSIAAEGLRNVLGQCKSPRALMKFKKELVRSYGNIIKKNKDKGKEFEIRKILAKLIVDAADKKNQLTQDKGILLDDKPKPPKGKMYRQLGRSLNG